MNFENEKIINDFFSEENLVKIYENKIRYSNVVGIDKMNNTYYMKDLLTNVHKISKKIREGNYELKPYRVLLLPKDVDSKPRKVCIPTINDRIVIEAIKEMIYYFYSDSRLNFGVSNTIDMFAKCYTKNAYTNYIKTDLSAYFDTIDHKILLKKLKKRVKDDNALSLIEKILQNEQNYNKNKGVELDKNKIGVPQGLSVSTLLANIYISEVDEKFCSSPEISYFRYVDDIFIFCNKKSFKYYIMLLIEMKKLKLKLNKSKTSRKKIQNSAIEFLGYSIDNNKISVKKKSINKLENSLEELFKNYYYSKEKNIYELKWRINLRISGAIDGNKRYGWLFYFKNIDDLNLLYRLDSFIRKLKLRYKVNEIETKTFVRTYHKMQIGNLKNSKYFLNIESVTDSEKIEILSYITKFSLKELNSLSIHELNLNFRKVIFKCLKSLERDLDNIS